MPDVWLWIYFLFNSVFVIIKNKNTSADVVIFLTIISENLTVGYGTEHRTTNWEKALTNNK